MRFENGSDAAAISHQCKPQLSQMNPHDALRHARHVLYKPSAIKHGTYITSINSHKTKPCGIYLP